MGFGYEIVMLLKFVLLDFGRWNFVDVADNQFKAVIELEKIL